MDKQTSSSIIGSQYEDTVIKLLMQPTEKRLSIGEFSLVIHNYNTFAHFLSNSQLE